jgi:iron complex transport system substrate-binding protein
MSHRAARTGIAGLLLLLLAGLLTACGSSSAAPQPSGNTAGGAFPVTIKGYLGTATIPAQPQRVIALANGDVDAAVALGVTPVAMAKDPDTANGLYPWLNGKLDPAKVTMIDTSTGVPLEQIATLHPDLILATNALDIATSYADLSKIAPTVTRPEKTFDQTWQQNTALVAKALGRSGAVAGVTKSVDDAIAATKAKYPKLNGATFSAAWVAAADQILIIKDKSDQAVRFMNQLGMRVVPAVANASSGTLSPENLGLLNADLVIVTYNDDSLRSTFSHSALFTSIPAVKAGRYLPISLDTITELRSPTAAGIPWLLDQLAPGLAKVGS